MTRRNGRILIVEDSEDFRTMVGRLYEAEGYAVEVATDGADALKKLHARPDLPALILVDIMMPVMDGFGFCKEVSRDPTLANIPILVMSADSRVEEKAKATAAQGCIAKPVDLDTLIAVAEKYAVTGESRSSDDNDLQ